VLHLPDWKKMTNATSRRTKAIACICALLVTGFGSVAFGQVLKLPPGATTPTGSFSSNQSLPSFAVIKFADLPAGFNVTNLTYLGWCADFGEDLLVSNTPPIDSENNAVYQLFNTYPGSGPGSTIPPNDQSPSWPKVSWILNHKTGESGNVAATVVDIQEAIWKVLLGSYFSAPPFTNSFDPSNPTPAAKQLVSDAETFGANFKPGPGQVVAILLDGISQPGLSGTPQDLIIEVTVPLVCPLTQGFWKNHTSAWKLTSLLLGTTTYAATEAETLLGTSPHGDASLILAHQLIAALLNIANGAPSVAIASTVSNADSLLGAGPIPENIPASSTLGTEMTNDASILDNYNSDGLTPGCSGG